MPTPRVLKRIMASEPVQWIASAIGAGYVLIVRWTSRIDRPAPPTPGPFIIAMWHGRLAMLHLLRFGEQPLVALISSHRDGQLISKCAWHYNIQTVVGSSSRGGIGAARRLIRLAREGHNLFITPDGPRGPRMHANENIVDLSLLTSLPILPAAISTSGGKELATWDRFLVPVPFSRIAARWGEPFRVGPGDDKAAISARLEASLNTLQREADHAVDRPCAV
ncbi:MAG: lysophospholipid acyltransferase family protein [Steroidobacteraceae bacterium]